MVTQAPLLGYTEQWWKVLRHLGGNVPRYLSKTVFGKITQNELFLVFPQARWQVAPRLRH